MFFKTLAISVSIVAVANALSPTVANASPTPKFSISTLLLPNGKTLTTDERGVSQATWRHVRFSVKLLGVPVDHPYGQSVVGNHSQLVSQQWIDTPYGRAWFALNQRTSPAASGDEKPSYEYWVAMNRSGSFDYCIEAIVTGNRAQAKQTLMNVVNRWIVPYSADASDKPPVRVIVESSSGNLPLARAVQKYLENVSDPTLFKRFDVLKLTYSGKHFGHPEWTVELNVQNQPGKILTFRNGVNERIVDFVVYHHQDYVLGLATGP